jgi:MSHA pilin protein MshA
MMKISRGNQRGFTLIELIIVIVILGILGVVAAPKYLGLSSDARTSTMHGLKGALTDGAHLVYAQALLEGVETEEDASITINDIEVDLKYGYPQSAVIKDNGQTQFASDLVAWMELDAAAYSTTDITTDWLLTDDVIDADVSDDDGITEEDASGISMGLSNDGTGIGFILSDYQYQYCGVSYVAPTYAGGAPTITIYDSDC